MITGAGKPQHVNGTATNASFQKHSFVRGTKARHAQNLIFQVTGAVAIRLSLDNGNEYFTVQPGTVIWERWLLSHFHVQSTGANSTFEALITEV